MILESYTIESAVIEITYIDDTTEDFTLEAPNGSFVFGGEQLVIRGDYRDKNKVLRKGQFKYHLFWDYEYETHEMDLRNLLIAKKITLKAPPGYYGGPENYASYEVRLQNEEAIKDYYQGVISATTTEDEMPSGGVTLSFKTITPLTWSEYLNVAWFQEEIQLQPDPPENFAVEVVEASIDELENTVNTGIKRCNVGSYYDYYAQAFSTPSEGIASQLGAYLDQAISPGEVYFAICPDDGNGNPDEDNIMVKSAKVTIGSAQWYYADIGSTNLEANTKYYVLIGGASTDGSLSGAACGYSASNFLNINEDQRFKRGSFWDEGSSPFAVHIS